MKASTAAVALVALLAISCIAEAAANRQLMQPKPAPKIGFCRTSAYTVDCTKTEGIKRKMFAICGKGVIRAVGKYVPNRNGCACSVVQKVDTSDAWDAFQACQETKGKDDFALLQNTRCKAGQAKGPC